MTARCTLTDLPVDGCAHCRPPVEAVDWSAVHVEVITRARFPGWCALDPEHPVAEGEWIGRTEAGFICQRCIKEARKLR